MKQFVMMLGLLLTGTFHAGAVDFETAAEAVKHMGLGWNMGNTLEANNQSVTDVTNPAYWGQQGLDSESCWGQYPAKAELLKMMKDAGFGAIRVPVTWYNHMDKDGKVDAAWMARVHEVVDYVINQGLYCIINVHHDTGADSEKFKSWIKADEANYAQNKERYENLWRQIAGEFKDYGQQLLFESYNEMLDKLNSWCFASMNASGGYNASDATSAYNAINSYAQSFVKTVRGTGGNNAQRNLIVNTYCASNGYGTWNTHLKDPLTTLKKPEGESNHIAFEIHAYPDIVKKNGNTITGDRSIADIKKEVDGMISLLKTNLVSKGAPVIFGEWGTSNVDANVTDYDARRELMFQFCEYFVQKCKANDIGTFYWMGLTDGAARLFPAFSQPDLAKCLLQAYHGSSFNPMLPERNSYANSCISCTVDFKQPWSEFTLAQGSFTVNDYIRLVLELESAPASGAFSVKIYGSSESTKGITDATTTVPLSANLGTITRITLQCNKATGSARVKNVWLVKKSGEKIPSDPCVFWGCTMRDVTISSPTSINEVGQDVPMNGGIYDLSGRRISQEPEKGIYIKDGKKIVR